MFTNAETCQHYKTAARPQAGGTYLPTFKGTGARYQTGHGWMSNAWSTFLYPHMLKPLVTQYILPHVKRLFSERVLPNVKRGFADLKGDLRSGNKVKDSIKRRTRETWSRIKNQDGSGRRKRRKRPISSAL